MAGKHEHWEGTHAEQARGVQHMAVQQRVDCLEEMFGEAWERTHIAHSERSATLQGRVECVKKVLGGFLRQARPMGADACSGGPS